jgi:peptide/nickel transport system permease protein
MDEASSKISTEYTVKEEKRRAFIFDLLRRLFREKPLGAAGAIIVLLLLFTGIFANFLAPYGYSEAHPEDYLAAPSSKYILGTDNLGRDQLSRVIYGARISLVVGLAATSISALLASAIGISSGFIGGKFDLVVQRFVDGWLCFPPLILLISIISVTGPGMVQVIVVLGALYGIGGSRIVRSAVIGIKENVYVEAARAVGCSTTKTIMKHILPNVMAPIIILFSTQVPSIILTEASLSFLGLGIPPPMPSWGGMLSGSGRSFMLMAPWMVIWPGAALALTVYGVNMFGDALRDLLDPRLRGGIGRYGLRPERGGQKKRAGTLMTLTDQ